MNDEPEDKEYELNKIRMKKMKALMEAKKRQEDIENRSTNTGDKLDNVLQAVLDPDAYAHLNQLKSKEPYVYQTIFNELITPEVIENIDYLLAVIRSRGGVQRRIPLDIIIFLERKVKGIKSTIRVQRKDEFMDLGSYLTGNDK